MGEELKNPKYLDLAELNAKLGCGAAHRPAGSADAGKSGDAGTAGNGRRVWRSLEELADTREFRDLMHREFPRAASEWDDGFSRRNFLKLMGASLALAGVSAGCAKRRDEKILPYVQQPEQVVPGRPLFFASTMPMGGFGRGVLVEQHEGRPTKIEGNPDHPASLGATNVWMQASVLQLYDPDRSQDVLRTGQASSWGTFLNELDDLLRFDVRAVAGGALDKRPRTTPPRVRILTETETSPTLADQVAALQRALPGLKWHTYDPVSRDNALAGARQVFGRELAPVYRFERAKVILSIDSNFLMDDPGSVRYARDYARSRGIDGAKRPTEGGDTARMSRMYAVESTPTITGTVADHHLRLPPEAVQAVARRIAAAVSGGGSGGPGTTGPIPGVEAADQKKVDEFISAAAADLRQAGNAAVVVAGEWQPPEIHALACAMNAALGSIGDDRPLGFIKPPEANPVNGVESLRELTAAMDGGEVDLLLILGGNPAYTAPADLKFADKLKAFTEKVRPDGKPSWSVHLGHYFDETSLRCQWHLPLAHYLEAWGDVRAYDGTASIIQPLIAPLYQGRSAHEVLAAVLERAPRVGSGSSTPSTRPSESQPAQGGAPAVQATSGYEIVRNFWRQQVGGGNVAGGNAAGGNAAGGNAASAGGEGSGGQPATQPAVTADRAFESWWENVLINGVIEGTAYRPEAATPTTDLAALLAAPTTQPTSRPAAGSSPNLVTLIFRPDPSVWDGCFSNVSWLQELPKPLTKLTWDNAAIISPRTAIRLGLLSDQARLTEAGDQDKLHQVNGRLVKLENGSLVIGDKDDAAADKVALWIQPGHPDGCVTVHLGYGRRRFGRVANGMGFNAYDLRTSTGQWFAHGATLTPRDGRYWLASTQTHQIIDTETNENRELVRHGTSAAQINEAVEKKEPFPADPEAPDHKEVVPDNIRHRTRKNLPLSLYPETPDQGTKDGTHNPDYPAWAMAIDLTACIGCNACVIACQAENNIPVVGKDQVLASRYMHWLRIDTYYVTEANDPASINDPTTFFQPVPCMHCEKAPCEIVCPVEATSHSVEGINEMTYNRCVGTRYCSNNCPYKVRRFNFLQYNDTDTPVLKLLRNPDVTVRNRGVMEKCTYCIQRISHGRISAKKFQAQAADAPTDAERQRLEGLATEAFNSVVSACAQACPTQAIVFGNINPKHNKPKPTEVLQLKELPTNYGLLDEELQTRPRTTYLAKIENPSRTLSPKAYEGGHGAEGGEGRGAEAPHKAAE